MWKMRSQAIWTAILCLGIACGPAKAQHSKTQGTGDVTSGADITASLSKKPASTTPSGPEVHRLKSGGVSATVTVLTSPTPFPAGGSAFAQIKLANTTKAKRVDAELVLEAETAVILDASGAQVKLREEGALRIASIKKIVRGRPRTVIVEVKLHDSPAGTPAGSDANKLKITLRIPGGAPGGSSETTTLSWPVTSCASGFYSEIVKVREGSGSGITAAIKAARSRDSTRPGRWLFPPRFKSAGATRKCIRRAKRWSTSRRRYVYRCTRYKTIRPVLAGAPATTKSERSVFRFASRYVSARAVDRELAQTRDSGWATNRVSQNLRDFLKQDAHPAICTGAIGFLDYFDERLAGFAKRADKFSEMASKSLQHAITRTGEAGDAIITDPGGHPGFGAAPLDIESKPADTSLKSQVENLARLANDAELGKRVTDAQTPFEGLRAMSLYFNGAGSKPLAPATRSAMYRALSAIESADYIGAVARHYSDLRGSIMGSMASIRRAHSTKCTCGG